LQDIWSFFSGKEKNDEDEKEEGEVSIAMQSIMRIMSLVIAMIPLKGID
jgi:hypothetical protein